MFEEIGPGSRPRPLTVLSSRSRVCLRRGVRAVWTVIVCVSVPTPCRARGACALGASHPPRRVTYQYHAFYRIISREKYFISQVARWRWSQHSAVSRSQDTHVATHGDKVAMGDKVASSVTTDAEKRDHRGRRHVRHTRIDARSPPTPTPPSGALRRNFPWNFPRHSQPSTRDLTKRCRYTLDANRACACTTLKLRAVRTSVFRSA